MIDLSSIYRNPRIPERYYYTKLVTLETEDDESYDRPRIFVKLKLHPQHRLGNIILSAIIHPTENATYHYVNFLNTFLNTWRNH